VSSKQEVVANGHLQVIGEVRNRRCRGFWWDADGRPLRFADAGEAWLLMVVRAVLGMLAPAAGSKRTRAGRSSARRSATRASVAAERSPAADEIQKVGAPGGALLLGHLEAGALEREAETIEDRPRQEPTMVLPRRLLSRTSIIPCLSVCCRRAGRDFRRLYSSSRGSGEAATWRLGSA
jgi:hypothetical protein